MPCRAERVCAECRDCVLRGSETGTEGIRKEYGRKAHTEGKRIRETGNAVQDDSAGSGRG